MQGQMVVDQKIKASSSKMDPGGGYKDFFVDGVIFYVNFTRNSKLKKGKQNKKTEFHGMILLISSTIPFTMMSS